MRLNRSHLLTAAIAILSLLAGDFGISQAATKPNFIIIFSDDLGYSDIGCFGSTLHRTPNIDQMAAE